MNVGDGTFFGLALGLASTVTVIPLFLNTLTTSTILIGLVASVHSIGWSLPQLLTSSYVSRLKRYKPMVIFMTIHERWPFLGLAILALLVPTLGIPISVALAIILIAIQGLAGGFAATAWQSMIGKIMPPERLGTFFGVQSGAANLMGAFGALLSGLVLDHFSTHEHLHLLSLTQSLTPGMTFDHVASSQSFALCFFLAAVAMAISFNFLARAREPAHEVVHEEVKHLGWRRMLGILREDANFRWYLVARILAQIAWMAVAFYTIYAVRRFQMDDVTAGVLTFVLMLSQTVANPILGWIGDRWSHRVVYAGGALLMALSAGLALVAPSLGWFYIIFSLAGIANATIWAIAMTFTLEFGKASEKPLYIGLANTLVAPAALVAPILGGWLADQGSFQTTFILSAVCGLLTAGLLLFVVVHPRRLAAQAEIRLPQPALET